VNADTFSKQAKVSTDTVCQLADGNCSLEQERSADGGVHATRDNNFRNELWNTK
jgi:hypothetical protein